MDTEGKTVLGINTSHDTAVAVIIDGEVEDVFEEERSRRAKYWSPHSEFSPEKGYSEFGLLCIDHKQLHKPDYLAFASFDRRELKFDVHKRVFKDRLLQGEMIKDFSAQQLNLARLEDIQNKYPNEIKEFESITSLANSEFEGEDDLINEALAHQVECQKYDFKQEHHYFHAVCGSHLSPYDECIVITWDGGGFQTHYDEWPNYQEIECIWHYKKEGVIAEGGPPIRPLYKRYSNHRFVNDLSMRLFQNWGEDSCVCYEDETHMINGVESVFTSLPSMGMNFSNMSHALGCDDLGRAAGKVMGMASYGKVVDNVWSKHTTANRLEHDSLAHATTVIQKAIDMVPDCKNIVLSGGYSLNCTNNYKYLEAFPEHQFFVDPIPHDGGTAVGCALDYWRDINDND
jgi:predicted NodU family carbamoyl transferase